MKALRKIIKGVWLVFLRPKGFFDYCLNIFCAISKNEKALGLPVHLTIEPANLCNLKCPVCETGSGILGRKAGMMSLADFEAIIDKVWHHTNSILFYYMGEPFLNNDAYKMIKYAKNKNIYVTTCTNGHFINVKEMIASGLDEISFQIGGVTEETHGIYRIGSNLKKILDNIKELAEFKKKSGECSPKIILGFIVMKHNEHEINAFKELAMNLEVDEARVVEPCVRTMEQARQFLPMDKKFWLYDHKEFDRDMLRPRRKTHNRCNWIYFSTVILYNGDIVPCCRDAHGKNTMGNLLTEDLKSIWNNEKYRVFRKKLKKDQAGLGICQLCSDFGIPTLY